MIRIQRVDGKWRITANDIKEIKEVMKPIMKGEDPITKGEDLPNKELLNMSLEDYIELKYDIVSRKWKKNQGRDGFAHEYLKGQYILLRELLEPNYRRLNP